MQGSDEFASPACSAYEMDPAYMWAPQRRPASWLRRVLDRLKPRRQP